ncbi:MAG: hypothetical protein ACOX23_07295 [Peptococcia bacterium]|jgi:hypothetical protein
MSKRIIIFYEHIKREYDACLTLKDQIERSNSDYKVFLYSITFEYFEAIKIADNEKIDMIIMPWIYTDKDYELVQPFVKRNANIYIANLHHEQIASEATEIVVLPSGECAKNSVVHLVWGSFFKEKLLHYNVRKDLIFVTGNIRTDHAFQTSLSREDISKEFQLDINKKWILFSESRGWVLTNSQKKDEHLISLGFSKGDIKERAEITKKSLERTIEEFDELSDAFFQQYELIYRPHPGTEVPKNINKRVKVIDKYPIYDWINCIDVNVVWSSTTIFESDLKSVPSIVYEPTKHPDKFQAYGLNQYPRISRFDEINEDIIAFYRTQIAPQKIYERYIGQVDGKSVERTRDVIIKILNKGIDGYKANRIGCNKKRFIKMYLFEKITRLFVKLGIIEIVRYPNTAYQMRSDIPYRDTRKNKIYVKN